MDTATIALTSVAGDLVSLVVSQLPRSSMTLDLQTRPGRHELTPTLREGATYRFRVHADRSVVAIEPAELFDFDDAYRTSGRIVTGENVGLVRVSLTDDGDTVFTGEFDIRSAKFADEQAFARMLTDLASKAVEALHQGFAAPSGEFRADAGAAPRLLYQQFAILHALLRSGDLSWALAHVTGQPHREWRSEQEIRPPGRPAKGSSRLAGQLSRPGARVPAPFTSLGSLPALLATARTEETVDTIPNRFVRFALERWRFLSSEVAAYAAELPGYAMRRGVDEAHGVVAQLDEVLSGSLFREVGRLTTYPGDNPVLRRREGYRQVAQAVALVEGSLGLELHLDDPFLVSRRSIATLYEYWTFVHLAEALARACDQTTPLQDLFTASRYGMSLVLRADATHRLQFNPVIHGREVLVDLFFNNEFRGGSWTRPMRPDASIVIRRHEGQEVWLHFDAKYRVDWQQPFETGDAESEEAAERVGFTRRSDLLKMHAYRDAIRNSAGAYVLFPGSAPKQFAIHDSEFLPGLGAFPLRPDRVEEDTDRLTEFFKRALGHVAASGTRHRRALYWTARAYGGEGTLRAADPPATIELPPADTAVLCGYIRSPEQRDWVLANRMYNIRGGQRRGAVAAGAPLLDAQLLLLYGPSLPSPLLCSKAGAWNSCTGHALERLGYRNPKGDSYLIADILLLTPPSWFGEVDAGRLRPQGAAAGEPFTVTWLDVVLSTQREGAR